MTPSPITSKPFAPGTYGWTAADLDDPEIERQWFAGRYEIVEGVLAQMPAAYFDHGEPLTNLVLLLKTYARGRKNGWRLSVEVDMVIADPKVARAGGVVLTADDVARQMDAQRLAGIGDTRLKRLLVPPTVVIESVSPGHELHDRQTKREWYARFGVPHYWLMDAFAQRMECLVLDAGAYRIAAAGRADDVLRHAGFPGLEIPLAEIWAR